MIEISTSRQLIRIDGAATVEDAEHVFNTLAANPGWCVDLTRCTHLHAAVLQTLMCVRPPLWLHGSRGPIDVLLQSAGLAGLAVAPTPTPSNDSP